ncbi:HNH endonuclease [Brucella sp. HL-2]|nr:HNH endonuclease signature motif containing protein [Brucella sp. HL-2]MCV9909960.1 HNH endonuclease [Brucella sp. HL-2]
MRTVPEWIGKTDNSMPTDNVKDRIRDRQGDKCALTGHRFKPGDKVEYDHVVPLWLGGENRESNLQAVLDTDHKRKTQAEATVRAKITNIRKKHRGIRKEPSMAGSKNSRFKKLITGEVIDRRTGELVGGLRP